MSAEQEHTKELLAKAESEMKRWDQPIVMVSDLTTMVTAVAAVQLALRHPGFKERPSAEAARKFTDSIIGQVDPVRWPAIREMMELGYRQEYDTPPEPCVWEEDYHASYSTGCGQAFIFNEDGPVGNGFKFCPYCGRPVEERKSIPADDKG